ncbi:MAG: NAD(+) synthase, partial [Spartobacteria bacterium]|nr:NAD(+) synthase [Spartobacteria bacterium]
MQQILIALAQVNPVVGNIPYNADKIVDAACRAADEGASLVLFPELVLSGYPPEDLILKDHFMRDCEEAAMGLADRLPKKALTVVGAPWREDGKAYNAALVYSKGALVRTYYKVLLPNYGVFDEKRVFSSGVSPLIIKSGGVRFGIHICEDSWDVEGGACAMLRERRVHAILNLSASPYHRGKIAVRESYVGKAARELESYLLYANLVGGQDELVFDGASMVISPEGTTVARAGQFAEEILYYPLRVGQAMDFKGDESTCVLDIGRSSADVEARIEPELDPLDEVYRALLLGLRDYVEKNAFTHVVVALSGGIDSALVAVLAVDALGADRVTCITMPSQYSSSGTLHDAGQLAKNLGVTLHTVPIKPLFDQYLAELTPYWEGRAPDITEENLQARIRGN